MTCVQGACACVSDCECRECGEDGCGGWCGDCDDGNDCTHDTCENHKCKLEVINAPGCCADEADCEDDDPCTMHACFQNKCLTADVDNCCVSDADCDSASVCETCACLPIGKCNCVAKSLLTQKQEGLECCQTDADCQAGGPWEEDGDNDGFPGPDNQTTLDYCVEGLCKHVTYPHDCDCGEGLECESSNPCVEATCQSNCVCTYSPVPDCCLTDDDCEDSIASTDDICVVEFNKCQHTFKACCCIDSSTCMDDDFCTLDLCLAEFGIDCCQHESIPGCCHDDNECDDCNPETVDICINHHCLHGPSVP